MKRVPLDRVTTRGGDRGMSFLANGEPLRKDDLLFDAMGDVDELSSFLGLARAGCRRRALRSALRWIQEKLLVIGAQLGTPRNAPLYARLRTLQERDLQALERREKALLDRTEIPPAFVLPGENPLAAQVDVARAVCRRAERRLVALIRERGLIHLALCQNYLNRLSDYLFILARHLSRR